MTLRKIPGLPRAKMREQACLLPNKEGVDAMIRVDLATQLPDLGRREPR